MTELEDDVQCALALIHCSIKQHGSEDKVVVGYKKCAPITNAMRGHKFLKENDYVTAAVRVGTFVNPPYRTLAGVMDALKRKYNTTLRITPFTVLARGKRRSGNIDPTRDTSGNEGRIGTRSSRGGYTSSSEHNSPRKASRTPRTRVKRQADVVSVSSSEEEVQQVIEDEMEEHYDTRHDEHMQHDEERYTGSDADVPSEGEDSEEIINTADIRLEEHGDEGGTVTGVKRRAAEQLVRGRFELQQQKFVHNFDARGVHTDIMMTIKLFGATIPVPKNTIVFQPSRDLGDESIDS